MDIKQGLGWFFVGLGVALVIAAIACPIAYYNVTMEKTAMEQGYEQELDRGRVIWKKAK